MSDPLKQPRTVYFHEDDFCQIELLPIAAREHCATQMGLIDDFAAKHAVPNLGGYTDIYVRPEAPHALAELNISITALAAAIGPHFPPYEAVFTGYSSYQEQCKNVMAWGDESFKIFAGYKADTVRHIWFDFGFDAAFDEARTISALRAIPQSNELLIADWSWSMIAALADTASLTTYFQQRTGDDEPDDASDS